MLHNALVNSQDYVETISIPDISPEKYIDNAIKNILKAPINIMLMPKFTTLLIS